jgi:hypothetical protein
MRSYASVEAASISRRELEVPRCNLTIWLNGSLNRGHIPMMCPGSADIADACGLSATQPAARQQLCIVAPCRKVARLQREKSRMIPQTAIVQIAKKIGRELNSGAQPSEEALAIGPILAEAGRV